MLVLELSKKKVSEDWLRTIDPPIRNWRVCAVRKSHKVVASQGKMHPATVGRSARLRPFPSREADAGLAASAPLSLRGSQRHYRTDAAHPKRSESAARCRNQSPSTALGRPAAPDGCGGVCGMAQTRSAPSGAGAAFRRLGRRARAHPQDRFSSLVSKGFAMS